MDQPSAPTAVGVHTCFFDVHSVEAFNDFEVEIRSLVCKCVNVDFEASDPVVEEAGSDEGNPSRCGLETDHCQYPVASGFFDEVSFAADY